MVPGVAAGLSAFGGLATDIRGEETATLHTSNRHFALDAVNHTLATLSERARRFLERAGVPVEDRRYEYAFQARYKYQSWEIEALFEPGDGGLGADDVPVLSAAFHDMHERITPFGKMTARSSSPPGPCAPSARAAAPMQDRPAHRAAETCPSGGSAAFISARNGPSVRFPAMTAMRRRRARRSKPALIDSDTTTILLLAGQRERTDSHGNFHIVPDAGD